VHAVYNCSQTLTRLGAEQEEIKTVYKKCKVTIGKGRIMDTTCLLNGKYKMAEARNVL
jgi:hypothetical protein